MSNIYGGLFRFTQSSTYMQYQNARSGLHTLMCSQLLELLDPITSTKLLLHITTSQSNLPPYLTNISIQHGDHRAWERVLVKRTCRFCVEEPPVDLHNFEAILASRVYQEKDALGMLSSTFKNDYNKRSYYCDPGLYGHLLATFTVCIFYQRVERAQGIIILSFKTTHCRSRNPRGSPDMAKTGNSSVIIQLLGISLLFTLPIPLQNKNLFIGRMRHKNYAIFNILGFQEGPVPSLRLLGIQVDTKLQYGPNIKKAAEKCQSQLLSLQRLSKSIQGATFQKAR